MKKSLLVLGVLALLIPAAGAQNNHNPVYLVGGYGTTSTFPYYPKGVFKYDKTTSPPTLTKLCDVPPWYTYVGTLAMDADNKHLLIQTAGTSSTMYPHANAIVRIDPATNTWTTLFRIPAIRTPYGGYSYGYPQYGAHVDQNGDYVLSVYKYKYQRSPTTLRTYGYYVYKVDHTSGAVSTILTSTALGRRAYFRRQGRDIDSGKAMFMDTIYMTSPSTVRYPVLTLNPEDGYNAANVGTWNDGSVYGWNNYYVLQQNVRNGNLEAPYYNQRSVYQLKPGSSGYTTLSTVSTTSLPYRYVYSYGAGYDLQTAPKPEFIASAYYYSKGAWLIHWDVGTWTVKSYDTMMTTAQYRYPYNYHFAFYQGRHIQTVATGTDKWDIKLSVPHHPNKAYAIAASASGVRPGIALTDGRNLNINFDVVMYMTLNNLLTGIWKPGPLKLDANGEATAGLDLSSLSLPPNGLGIPIWIALVVLDSAAPSGIAYAPDTYVMRI